jgi:RimJ/RimL family protein N-acetyltransferase
MSMPELSTPRLVIRAFTASDLDARHRLGREAFGDSGPLDDTRRWLEWTVASYRELARLYQPPYGDYAVSLKDSGEVIGSVGIVPSVVPWAVLDGEDSPQPLLTPEFGLFWAVLPAHQRQGYALEAARGIIDFLFGQMRVRRVVATTEFENHASQRVMEKLGMTIRRNSTGNPPWCQVVAILNHPDNLPS